METHSVFMEQSGAVRSPKLHLIESAIANKS